MPIVAIAGCAALAGRRTHPAARSRRVRSTPRLAAGALLVACALLPGAPVRAAADEPSQGPLEQRVPGTLRDLFLEMVPWDARAVEGPRLRVGWSMANDWTTPTTLAHAGQAVYLRLDEQTDSLELSFRAPWSLFAPGGPAWLRRVASEIDLRGTSHWGGWSDRPIQAWHGLWGFYGFYRGQYPPDQIRVNLGAPGPAALADVTAPVFSFDDLVLRNQVLLWEGGEPLAPGRRARGGVSLRMDVKIPTGSLSRLGGSGGWDAGVAASGSWQLASWLVGHATAGLSAFSDFPRPFPMQPRRWHGSFDLSLVFLAGGWSIVLEDRLTSPIFPGGWAYVDNDVVGELQSSATYAAVRTQNQVFLGVRWGPIAFWITEDYFLGRNPGAGPNSWFYNSNAPDLALGLTFTLAP